MNEHTVEIVEIIAGLVATIVTGFFGLRWKYLSNKKKSQANNENDVLAKVEEELAELKDPKEDEDTFINAIIEEQWFEDQMCELIVKIPCDIITLFVPEKNIEFGLSLKYESQNKNDIIRITHECRKSGVAYSEKDKHRDVLLGQYKTIIQHMEYSEVFYKDVKKGMLIINKKEDIKDPALLAIVQFAEKVSVVNAPIYRPEFGHRPSYMIAVLIIGTLKEEYTWTKEDLNNLHLKCAMIGERIDEIYEKFVARKLIEAIA